MTLTEPNLFFQGHGILEIEFLKNMDKVTIGQ